MRITDHHIVDMAAAGTARNESAVGALTNEVSTGLRVSKPSDDPFAWLAAQRNRVRAALNDGTTEAISKGHDWLVATDGALSTISGIVSQARQLAVEGANDTQNATSRAAIGAEVGSLFDAAVGAANSKDPSGEYLLAGTNSLAQPFDTTTGAYSGDAVTRNVNLDTVTTQIASVSGSSLTAANGVDVLPALKALATALNSNNLPAIQQALADLGTATTQLAQTRGQNGGHMAALESAKTTHDSLSTRIASSISSEVEVDAVTAATDLAKASSALTVAQTVTAHVLQLLDPNK